MPRVSLRLIACVALLTLLNSPLSAQISLTLSSAQAPPGSQTLVNVLMTAADGSSPAALEWTLHFASSDISVLGVTAGDAANAAGKSFYCNAADESYTCVLVGLNSNLIQNGSLAAVTLQLSATPSDSVPISISNLSASDGSGTAIPVTGMGTTFATIPRCFVLNLAASPNPIVADGTFQTTTVSSNVTCPYDIRLNGPTGTLWETTQGPSSSITGPWVIAGMQFYLQRHGSTSSRDTLERLTIQGRAANGCLISRFTANPNPIVTNDSLGKTTIFVSATCPYDTRLGSPDGPLFASGEFASSSPTGYWVTQNMTFFLQQGGDTTSAGTLSLLTVTLQPSSLNARATRSRRPR